MTADNAKNNNNKRRGKTMNNFYKILMASSLTIATACGGVEGDYGTTTDSATHTTTFEGPHVGATHSVGDPAPVEVNCRAELEYTSTLQSSFERRRF